VETDFYTWINAKIDESELSKRELAERAGISASLIYAVTTEGRDPSPAFCVSVAKVLNLPTNEVLRRAGFSTIPDPPDAPDPLLADAWRLLCELDDTGRRYALAMLKGLREGASGTG